MTLTAKQERFVEEDIVDLNATQAAIRAGYSPKTANREGSRLLSNVDIQAAVSEGMDEDAAQQKVEKLRRQGDVYEPVAGYIRTV